MTIKTAALFAALICAVTLAGGSDAIAKAAADCCAVFAACCAEGADCCP